MCIHSAVASDHATSQDNRMNCTGVRSDRCTLGLASRRLSGWDARKVFNTEEAGRTTEFHGVGCQFRFARSALNPYSVELRRPPCFLRAKILPGLRTANVFPVVGSNRGSKPYLPPWLGLARPSASTWHSATQLADSRVKPGYDGWLYGYDGRVNGCEGGLYGCDRRMHGCDCRLVKPDYDGWM
jgi:hypothetical protein